MFFQGFPLLESELMDMYVDSQMLKSYNEIQKSQVNLDISQMRCDMKKKMF